MATVYHTKQNERLDIICWHYYGDSRDAFEAVLEANPRLADKISQNDNLVLPIGLDITMPALPKSTVKPTIRLWD